MNDDTKIKELRAVLRSALDYAQFLGHQQTALLAQLSVELADISPETRGSLSKRASEIAGRADQMSILLKQLAEAEE